MAKAQLVPSKPLPPPPPDDVHLFLSMEEAEVLLSILERIGGPPEGPRGKADAISMALHTVDVKSKGFEVDLNHATIYFK